MNRLSTEKRAQIIGMLVVGHSMCTVSRMVDCSINTVTKLLVDVGAACAEYQGKVLRDLPCRRVLCDEIWSFCCAKEKNAPEEGVGGELGYGDVYTRTAMCVDTKLVLSFMVGNGDSVRGGEFMLDLSRRLKNRMQLAAGGRELYSNAIGSEDDCAMLVKICGKSILENERGYSRVECTGAEMVLGNGNFDESFISAGYAGRQDIAMHMGMGRFERLASGFSKRVGILYCAVALHLMYYNFAKTHKTLKVTPAMEAGISDHEWTLEEIAEI